MPTKTQSETRFFPFQLHLECDNDLDWKIAMVGTANNLGRFVLMPVMGLLSDRLGRRTIVIIGVLGSTIFAFIRSFATNYYVYVLFEFLDAGIGSVTYSASFILALEWVGVEDRILLGSLFTATYPFGQIFLGFVAKTVKDYRRMLQIIYAPGFLIIFYCWISSESIRWLIVNRKRERIFSTLERAEKLNGLKLSQDTIDRINVELNPNEANHTHDYRNTESKWQQFRQILMKRTFIIRFLICAFVWFTNAFVTYGISLTSVALAGDKYINFVVIALAGIPAMLFVYFLMESLGRRWTISMSLMIGGLSIIASKILPPYYSVLSITFFFLGKCFITVSFTGLYVYTSELWPTNIRNSMMSFCSTIGRIGAALAPMAPLLVIISCPSI